MQILLIIFVLLKIFWPSFLFPCDRDQNKELWLSNFSLAERYFLQGEFERANEYYSLAMKEMDEPNENFQITFNARGFNYIKLRNFDAAINDFDKVIQHYIDNPKTANLNHALTALWSRLGIFSRQGKLEEAVSDYQAILKLDPNLPKIECLSDKLVISNLDLKNNPKIKSIFSSTLIKLGICDDPEKIISSSSGINTISLTEAFSSKISQTRPYCKQCLNDVFNHTKVKNQVGHTALFDCQKWCDDVAVSVGLACAFCPTSIGKAACTAAIYSLKEACHWCCSDGNFYKKCLQPLQAFNPRDVLWDDDDLVYPDRDLNDPNIVWNWDDI